jgi:DNA-binding IclR family transcriptional regulator
VGASPRGLTVKQIARRCELTVATTYHLVRTLAYEGYVTRREDGTYMVGMEVSDRFRELVVAFRGPPAVGDVLRRAALDSGYSHYLARFVGGRVVLTAVSEGPRSPYLEDLIPGFDDGAHATALGKALLATLSTDQRGRYLRDFGMRQFTAHTLITPEALEADLAQGERRMMHLEVNQFRAGVGCASLVAINDRDVERRVVLACAMPAAELLTSAKVIRSRLATVAKNIATAYGDDSIA